MIEISLQISCDGVGDDWRIGQPTRGGCDSTAVSEETDITKTEFRRRMEKYGWSYKKGLDLCPECRERARLALQPRGRYEIQ